MAGGGGSSRIARGALFATLRYTGVSLLVRRTVQRRRVTVLEYHEISPEVLDRHLAVLGQRYNFVSLRDYVTRARSGRLGQLPENPLVITIDDGRKSIHDIADVFRRHRVTPTVFLCSGVVGTSRQFWWMVAEDPNEAERWKRMPDADRLEELKSRGFTEVTCFTERCALSHAEVADLTDIMDFQPHTVFHPILTMCTDERAWSEIHESKRDLEERYGVTAYAFSYPNGDYSQREIDYLKAEGFECAVTSDAGYNAPDADLLRLRRVGMDDAETVNEIVSRACGLPAIAKQMLQGAFRRRSALPNGRVGATEVGGSEALERPPAGDS